MKNTGPRLTLSIKDRERVVSISITPYKVPLNVISEQIQTKINNTDIQLEINIEVGGAVEEMAESMPGPDAFVYCSV